MRKDIADKFLSVPNMTSCMGRFVFGPGYTPSLPLPLRPLLFWYVPGDWRNELPVTAIFNSIPLHCEIWRFEGNGTVLREYVLYTRQYRGLEDLSSASSMARGLVRRGQFFEESVIVVDLCYIISLFEETCFCPWHTTPLMCASVTGGLGTQI